MSWRWQLRGWPRACVALIAAYALAIQMLLGAALAQQAAGADPFILCTATTDGAPGDHGGTGKLAPHDHCVLCQFGKGSHAVLGGAIAAPAPDLVSYPVRVFRSLARITSHDSRNCQYQRGPPAGVIA